VFQSAQQWELYTDTYSSSTKEDSEVRLCTSMTTSLSHGLPKGGLWMPGGLWGDKS